MPAEDLSAMGNSQDEFPLESKLLREIKIKHGFFGAQGGVSNGAYASLNTSLGVGDSFENVRLNREKVLQRIGADKSRFLSLKQVHGAHIVQVTRRVGASIEADGMISRDPGAALAILTADCVPILCGAENGLVGAVHGGWRGTEQHIAGRLVERMGQLGCEPGQLRVAIGPAIGPKSFEVGLDTWQSLSEAYPGVDSAFLVRDGRYFVDLWRLNEADLVAAGVLLEHIDLLAVCTYEDHRFFSYRRDGAQTGRQAALIVSGSQLR